MGGTNQLINLRRFTLDFVFMVLSIKKIRYGADNARD